MKKWKRQCAVAAALVMTVSALSACSAEVTEAESNSEQAVAAVTMDIDPDAIRPQDDYYGYINAEHLMNSTPAYGEVSSGTFDDVTDEVETELYEIIREIAESEEDFAPGSSEQLIHDLYIQALAYENDGSVMKEVSALVEEIKTVQDINELLTLWTELSRTYGMSTPLAVRCEQDYFEAGNYALYIKQLSTLCQSSLEDISDDDDMCFAMKQYISDTLLPFEGNRDKADEAAEAAVYLALEIARSTDFEIQHVANPYAAYEFISEEELEDIFTNLNDPISKLYLGLDENPYNGWYIQDKGQLRKINELLTNDYLEQWKTILINNLVTANMSFLCTESPSLSAYGDNSTESREAQVCDAVVQALYDCLSDLYAQKFYTDEADAVLREMCELLRESYRELIADADWISLEGRESLLKKLENMTFVLGGGTPKKVDPADAELIADNYPETLRRLNENAYDESLSKIGTEYDFTRPGMGTFEVNACYSPSNTVTITVAIMHAPFFDVDADMSTNLGGLGTVVAHEMGHGFDSICLSYDDQGNYNPEWLSEEDRAVLIKRAELQSNYYSQYTILDVYHVDGNLTNAENYADLGAMECITNIMESDEELEKLFENYARIWATSEIDTYAIEMLEADAHSPNKVRVNAILSSCDKFYEVYDVKEGDGMYIAPDERVSRW